MRFQKRQGMRELASSRMCLASERVDALEVKIAALGKVEERGIDKRLSLLVASTQKSCKDVAMQLNRERLEGGGGIANGAGKWQGNMDREQLMGHGYIVERGLLQALRSELGELLVAGRKAFELTKAGRVKSLTKWRRDGRWAKVHAQQPRVVRGGDAQPRAHLRDAQGWAAPIRSGVRAALVRAVSPQHYEPSEE